MEDFRSIGKQLSNWARFGPNDERGTLNLVTPERLVRAAGLVRSGKALGIPFDRHGPQTGAGRINPVRLMSETRAEPPFPGAFRFADDYVFMPLQSASQWDALAHVHYDGLMYNGYRQTRSRCGGRAATRSIGWDRASLGGGFSSTSPV